MRREFRKHIQANILHRLVSLKGRAEVVAALEESEDLQKSFSMLESAAVADFEYTDENNSFVQEVLDAAVDIGTLAVIQEAVKDVYYNAPWDYMYFDSVRRIFRKDYEPSKEDIFICRKPTTGLCEYIIRHIMVDQGSRKGVHDLKQTREVWLEFVDVGGTNVERKRWEYLLKNCDGILYFVAMTDFSESAPGRGVGDDYYSYLNHGQRSDISMEYSKDLFATTFATKKTSGIPIVLILSKHDLFVRMIETGDRPLTKCLDVEYKGPSQDGKKATDFLTQTLTSSLKMYVEGLELYRKVDRMPIFHMNLIEKVNFSLKFNQIWLQMEDAIDDMKVLREKIQEDFGSGRAKSLHGGLKNKISVFRQKSNGRGKAESIIDTPGYQEGLSETVRARHHPTKAMLYRKPSFEQQAFVSSATELISGDNVSVDKGRDRYGKRLSSTALVRGIRRTKSYHWN
ncbi:subunit alpha of guanine nucleotide-binding protein [Chloropicon primus]|uniref:Subunit alpha of guanine nucleotide-binding protein n=1 Tax=Chloropicon primus TaxID=1764295 RepID=A0A5B8MTC4_9CHLO|nr:subunit alpha of guanine nucleotide-binding protein [Chloropicon primus]UPR01876.1 subunit alpha of guanine nucleotide-binding protein [Chloropicon primus]|eukprot:QDZ22652.1 subunit alpha of guanine nucleotide-binding protein [Chloropicon primus]